jgi:hypothetical protein
MTYSAPFEVQNPSIGVKDEQVDFTSDIEVEETIEVEAADSANTHESVTFELNKPPPVQEEDEFFDFSQADIRPVEFESPTVESEAEDAPEPAKRAKKV